MAETIRPRQTHSPENQIWKGQPYCYIRDKAVKDNVAKSIAPLSPSPVDRSAHYDVANTRMPRTAHLQTSNVTLESCRFWQETTHLTNESQTPSAAAFKMQALHFRSVWSAAREPAGRQPKRNPIAAKSTVSSGNGLCRGICLCAGAA